MGFRRLRQQALGAPLVGGCETQLYKQLLAGRAEIPAAAVGPDADDDEAARRLASKSLNQSLLPHLRFVDSPVMQGAWNAPARSPTISR